MRRTALLLPLIVILVDNTLAEIRKWKTDRREWVSFIVSVKLVPITVCIRLKDASQVEAVDV